MPKKVLIFEADSAFADELKGGLQALDCEVSVVDDANVGLQDAASNKPDLILLAIELPRMNGFSVCNKLKRDANLKSVPLIIMSSDSTEETFEQHRRLRTRAEDYVHKPIRFRELLNHMNALADIGEAPVEDDDIILEDDIILDDAEIIEEVDDEVEDFTEQAFDALIEEPLSDEQQGSEGAEAEPATEQESDAAPMAEREVEPGPVSLDADEVEIAEEVVEFGGEVPAAGAAEEAVPVQLAGTSSGVASVDGTAPVLSGAKERITELERDLAKVRERLAETEKQAEKLARLEQELELAQRDAEDARRKLEKASTGKAAGSAREFLELKEQLNRKDKEILDLRDQVTHRDKEILSLRDASLGIERAKADLDDRLIEIEKELADTRRRAEAHQADREQAAKRADDFKRRAEKLQGDLDAKNAELDQLRSSHAEDLARRDAAEESLKVEHQQTLDRAEQDGQRAVEAAEEQGRANVVQAIAETRASVEGEARAACDQALVAREEELKAEFDRKLGLVHRANEEALNKLKAEHEQLVSEALADRDRTVAGLEADLKERTSERERIDEALQAERKELEKARNKWDQDRGSLEQAKDALAAVLARMEEIESRPLD